MLDWKDKHTEAFNQIRSQIKLITKNKHWYIETNKSTMWCQQKSLGACLKQKSGNLWKPIAFASRFLNNLDSRYSTNQLELLAVVWVLEHFEYYLYGSEFLLQTDHKALLTALKENRGNKTYQSRLSRWVDRLLPIHFSVEHLSGKNMWFADYLRRNPTGEAIPPSDEDKNFIINAIEKTKFFLLRNALTPNGATISTYQFTDTKQVKNDVINTKQVYSNTNSAFCLHTFKIQVDNRLHSFNPKPTKTQIPFKLVYKNIVGITTRHNTIKETFNIRITRRSRAPNRIKKLQMEQPSGSKSFTNLSTQTEYTSNKGKGLDSLDHTKHLDLFTAYQDLPTPTYRENLNKLFNEEFLMEASQKELKVIIDLVNAQNWEDLKKINPLYFRIRRDLSVTHTNSLLYDNRLVIPSKTKQLVLDTIHHKHSGQVGMLAAAELVWWPHICEIVSKAKACRHCTEKGKNAKSLISKNHLGKFPQLKEPKEEIQMDFAGPIPYKVAHKMIIL